MKLLFSFLSTFALAQNGNSETADFWDISIDQPIEFNSEDPIYKEFKAMQATENIMARALVGSTESAVRKMKMRKFDTLKKMIAYLDNSPRPDFGKSCHYGCHCLVDGMDDILAGYGQPVDEIDSACKRYKQCVKCALTDFGTEVCPWYKPYKMTAMVDTETGEKHLVCMDKAGYCKNALCECDAQLAKDMAANKSSYNKDFHSRYGGFNREDECRNNSHGGTGGNGGTGYKGEGREEQVCCGEFPQRFPYSPSKYQCCDSKISSFGTC